MNNAKIQKYIFSIYIYYGFRQGRRDGLFVQCRKIYKLRIYRDWLLAWSSKNSKWHFSAFLFLFSKAELTLRFARTGMSPLGCSIFQSNPCCTSFFFMLCLCCCWKLKIVQTSRKNWIYLFHVSQKIYFDTIKLSFQFMF